MNVLQALRAGHLQPSMLTPLPKGNRPGLSTLVLDEADLMLSMPGYEADMREIIPKVGVFHASCKTPRYLGTSCASYNCHIDLLLLGLKVGVERDFPGSCLQNHLI